MNGKEYVVRELASQEMKNAGATWDAATAGNGIGTWPSSFGDQTISLLLTTTVWVCPCLMHIKDNKVPTFGYDANSDAVAAIAEATAERQPAC
ncbi:MAG: hypothetical protein ACLRL6_17675 [Clostridium sp.]